MVGDRSVVGGVRAARGVVAGGDVARARRRRVVVPREGAPPRDGHRRLDQRRSSDVSVRYHPFGVATELHHRSGVDGHRCGLRDPSFDEVVAVREDRMATSSVRSYETLTNEDLHRKCGDQTVLLCLLTLFDEEWHHNWFANRDLDVLTARLRLTGRADPRHEHARARTRHPARAARAGVRAARTRGALGDRRRRRGRRSPRRECRSPPPD